jgi:hypothetical protein
MLRFTQPAAHAFPSRSNGEGSEPGVDWFVFSPSWRKTPKDEVIPFLLSQGSPLMIFPTLYRGSVGLLVLDEVRDERKKWFQKTLDNQVAGVHQCAIQLNLVGESRVLLEFAEEEHLFSFAILQEWAKRYCVGIGWSVGPCGDSRAEARLNLIGPEGLRSWCGSCLLPPRE